MAKVALSTIESGVEGWDALANDNFAKLTAAPIPLFSATAAQLAAGTLVPGQNDDGLAIQTDGTGGPYLVFSNGGAWKKVGTQCASQANSVAGTVGALVTDFNALLAKLKASGLMA